MADICRPPLESIEMLWPGLLGCF